MLLHRLITSFTAADPFEDGGMEWVRLSVKGQSFVLHQIRKMVRFLGVYTAAADSVAPGRGVWTSPPRRADERVRPFWGGGGY